MENGNEIKDVSKKTKDIAKKINVLKKLDPETARVLQQLKDRANKKSFGRKIRDSEIINLGLKQLGQDHLLMLQEATLTGKDRLAIAHETYQKTHGKITLDQFIAKLVPSEPKFKEK